MKQNIVGVILIILGVVLAGLLYYEKQNEDTYIKAIMQETGSCFLEDGTCLHADRDLTAYLFGGGISVGMILFGLYLVFIDKTQESLERHQVTVSKALENASKKDEFKAFLAGFSDDEQKILKAVKEQEGIKQSTLRFKTDLSKTTVSIVLKHLEEKGIVRRKDSGKTKEVYLVSKF